MNTITQHSPLKRMRIIVTLCDALDEIDSETYEDLNELREGQPATYAVLESTAFEVGYFLDDNDSAYGNSYRIRTTEEKSSLFLSVEKTITLEIAKRIKVVFICGESGTCYSAQLVDETDLFNIKTTNLSEDEIALVLKTYDLDLTDL
jgi:hypothetical protein